MKVYCEVCKHSLKEKNITVMFYDPKDNFSYFCCDIFGVVELGSKCEKIKNKKIDNTFYIKSMKEAN